MRGKLIAFEGPDASGKTTQVSILKDRLRKEGKNIVVFKFPTYKTYYGKLLKRYLKGEFGRVEEVSPYLAGVLYALDRLAMRQDIVNELNKGKIVLFDRYVASSKAHMGAKIKNSKKREEFIQWLEQLEFGKNKMPREDLIIFLEVPVEITLALMQKMGKKRDIHEINLKYIKAVWEVYRDIARKERWARIKCIDNGKMLSREKIAEEIYKKVREKL